MREIAAMTKRNLFVYFRNRSTVFFSVLSALILLGIMVIFLGSSASTDLTDVLNKYGKNRDAAADTQNAAQLIRLWILGGMLGVNSVTVSLTSIGAMVQDEECGRLTAFYAAPVRRLYLTLGYIFSAWACGMLICLVTLGAGELFFVLKGFPAFDLQTNLKLTGILMLNVFVFSAIGYLMALFIHSASAWSGMLTVIGTLVGFAGGTYISVGSMSAGLQTVLKCLPVLHGTAMLRRVCTDAAAKVLFDGLPDAVLPVFQEKMGIVLKQGTAEISTGSQVGFLLLWAAAAIAAAAVIGKNRKTKDR